MRVFDRLKPIYDKKSSETSRNVQKRQNGEERWTLRKGQGWPEKFENHVHVSKSKETQVPF